MSMRARKLSGACLPNPPGSERAEIETMQRRLEELRRVASSNDLRAAYLTAIYTLDAVVYHLTMLLESPTRPEKRRAIWVTDPSPPSPKGAAAARPSRVGAAHKPPR